MYLRGFVQEALHRLGWDVRRTAYPSSEEVLLERFLAVVRPDAVVDVGANTGQYGLSLRKCGFKGQIVSFEAIAAVHARLAATAAKDPGWIIAPSCALGAAHGETNINVAVNSVSSSLLPINDAHLRAAPDSRYVASEHVVIERLDEAAKPWLAQFRRVLLKIDTQGYEDKVLAGAEGVLHQVAAMQLEMSVAPLYVGAPLMRQLLQISESLGFELHGLIPGFYEEKSGRLLQVDGLFVRSEPALR